MGALEEKGKQKVENIVGMYAIEVLVEG